MYGAEWPQTAVHDLKKKRSLKMTKKKSIKSVENTEVINTFWYNMQSQFLCYKEVRIFSSHCLHERSCNTTNVQLEQPLNL